MTTTSFNAAALVNEICIALGKDFAVTREQSIGNPAQKYGCWAFVVESPELGIAKLLMRVEEFTGRIDTQATWPMVNHRQVTASTYIRSEIAETIGGYPKVVGAKFLRGPAVVATDLRRRLLPSIAAFEPLIADAIVKEATQERFARDVAKYLSDELGYSADHFERRKANGANNSFPIRLDAKVGAPASATFQVQETGTTDVKLTGLTKAQVKTLINALKLNG